MAIKLAWLAVWPGQNDSLDAIIQNINCACLVNSSPQQTTQLCEIMHCFPKCQQGRRGEGGRGQRVEVSGLVIIISAAD